MDLDMKLDIMGTLPSLFKLYTQLAFVFPLPRETSQSTVISTLSNGIERLSAAFPWVAGQVQNTNLDSTAPPTYKIRPFEPTPRLNLKDYTKDESIPSLEEMENAGFPMSMMNEQTWAPCPTLASSGLGFSESHGNGSDPAPVLLLQMSFIRGGMVLCINMQHNVCDMLGQASVIELLSKACRGEDFTKEDIRIGNLDRTEVVQIISEDGWKPGAELENQIFPTEPPTEKATAPDAFVTESLAPPKCSWVYFDFSAVLLKELRAEADATLPADHTGFISTDDALSAFIFQRVLRARSSRLLSDPNRSVTFARAVDARRYLAVSSKYCGILQNMTYTSYPLLSLLDTPLGHVAAAMRRQVDPEICDIAYRTRSLITYLSQSPEAASKVSFTATLKNDADIMLSSWTKVPAYQYDFGHNFGKPIAVRRPGFVPYESLMYLMPKDAQGGVAAAMSLRAEDLQRLKEDLTWQRFAKYLG
jgi:hypothetical protein